MPTIDGEIVIGRPVEVVFDCVADQRNETAYNPRMVSSQKLTDGPVGVGTRFRATVRAGRRPVDMLIEVTGYRRPERLASRTTTSSADIDGGLTFQQVPGGTRMSWSWRLAPKGVLRLFSPVVGYLGRRQERRIWTGLKHHLEGRSTVASPAVPTSGTGTPPGPVGQVEEAAMSSMPEEDREGLRELARERDAAMPAETALGNRDPQGGGSGDPETYPGDENAPRG